jgi:hypothetical protein
MRNIIEYPITTDEIVKHLRRHLQEFEQSETIGSTEGLCLQEAIRRVRQYDDLAAKAEQLVGNYKALSVIVGEFCRDHPEQTP